MVAEKVNYIPPGTIDINDDLQEYFKPSEDAVNNLEIYDIPRVQEILDKTMRVISENEPSNPKQGMAWFKLFN